MTVSAVEVRVPDIGDFTDVTVIEVLVAPGDRVAVEQSLVTLESDKASMEIPSPAAGVVTELIVKVGDRVSEGSPMLRLEASDAPAANGPAPAVAAPPAVPPSTPVALPTSVAAPPAAVIPVLQPVLREPHEAVVALPHASPSIRTEAFFRPAFSSGFTTAGTPAMRLQPTFSSIPQMGKLKALM